MDLCRVDAVIPLVTLNTSFNAFHIDKETNVLVFVYPWCRSVCLNNAG